MDGLLSVFASREEQTSESSWRNSCVHPTHRNIVASSTCIRQNHMPAVSIFKLGKLINHSCIGYLQEATLMPPRYHFSVNERIAPIWVVPTFGYALTNKKMGQDGMSTGVSFRLSTTPCADLACLKRTTVMITSYLPCMRCLSRMVPFRMVPNSSRSIPNPPLGIRSLTVPMSYLGSQTLRFITLLCDCLISKLGLHQTTGRLGFGASMSICNPSLHPLGIYLVDGSIIYKDMTFCFQILEDR